MLLSRSTFCSTISPVLSPPEPWALTALKCGSNTKCFLRQGRKGVIGACSLLQLRLTKAGCTGSSLHVSPRPPWTISVNAVIMTQPTLEYGRSSGGFTWFLSHLWAAILRGKTDSDPSHSVDTSAEIQAGFMILSSCTWTIGISEFWCSLRFLS